MKLSSKTVTAIKLFVDLGEQSQDAFISLKDIAERKGLSKKFLEQIVPIYKNNGLLQGKGGNQGGYKLTKAPAAISLKEIILPLENALHREATGYSPLDTYLTEVDNLLEGFFQNISLEALIEKQRESYSYNYSI